MFKEDGHRAKSSSEKRANLEAVVKADFCLVLLDLQVGIQSMLLLNQVSKKVSVSPAVSQR